MREKQQYIKESIEPLKKLLDSLPIGEQIPSQWSSPSGFEMRKCEVGGVKYEHLIPENSNNTIIYQLHGGAYVVPLIDAYRDLSVELSKLTGGAEVILLDYKIAPKNKYPNALNDSVVVYQHLLEEKSAEQKIVFFGDSAGGNLALATTLYCKDHGIELPEKVVVLSPVTSAENNLPSRKINKEKDLVLGTQGIKLNTQVERFDYAVDADSHYPYLSPIYGDYQGFPELLIQVGSYEVLYDDSAEVAKRAEQAGVDVKFSVYEAMPHDFSVFVPGIEESQQAWLEVQKFFNF